MDVVINVTLKQVKLFSFFFFLSCLYPFAGSRGKCQDLFIEKAKKRPCVLLFLLMLISFPYQKKQDEVCHDLCQHPSAFLNNQHPTMKLFGTTNK